MGTLRPRHDEFVDVLLPGLEEVVTLLGDGALRQGTDNDLISLREANARLRTIARQLSNLVGDQTSSKVEAKDAIREAYELAREAMVKRREPT